MTWFSAINLLDDDRYQQCWGKWSLKCEEYIDYGLTRDDVLVHIYYGSWLELASSRSTQLLACCIVCFIFSLFIPFRDNSSNNEQIQSTDGTGLNGTTVY